MSPKLFRYDISLSLAIIALCTAPREPNFLIFLAAGFLVNYLTVRHWQKGRPLKGTLVFLQMQVILGMWVGGEFAGAFLTFALDPRLATAAPACVLLCFLTLALTSFGLSRFVNRRWAGAA